MSLENSLTPAQEKKLDRWLAKTGMQSMMLVNIMEGKWHNVDKVKLWALYESEQQRHKEGWYASFEDVYGDLIREFEGLPPIEKPAPEERFKVATQLFLSDCRNAVSKTMLLAREGYPPAMAKAAEIFYEGALLPERLDLALMYAEKARDAGYTGVLALLALLYAEGCGRKKNLEMAVATLQQAIDSNNPDNYRYIAINYATGEALGGECQPEQAEEYLVKAVANNNLQAAVDHFYMVHHGAIPEPRHQPSEVFSPVVEVGYPPALHELAKFYLSFVAYDEELPDDERDGYLSRAIDLIIDAAKAGYPPVLALINEDPEFERFGGGKFRLSEYIQFDEPETPVAVCEE